MTKISSETLPNCGEDLPTSPADLFNTLKSLNIPYEYYEHEAVFTVAESEAVDTVIPGTHCRNLFLRDKKKKNYLLVLPVDIDLDIKKLSDVIGSARLSFGSNERLWEYLGVRSGSVCPFAITNDTGNNVTIILEKSMMEQEVVNYHPLLNTMTISVSPNDLVKFIEHSNHEAHIMDLSDAKPNDNEGEKP